VNIGYDRDAHATIVTFGRDPLLSSLTTWYGTRAA
jgi:hypothetical protein